MDRACRGVHRVVDETQRPLLGSSGIIRYDSLDAQLSDRVKFFHVCKLVFGDCEIDENWLNLIDDDEYRNIVSLHKITFMYLKAAGSAVDGRIDGTIFKVQLRRINGCLIGPHLGI